MHDGIDIERLREEVEMLRTIIDSMSDGVSVAGRDGRLVLVNRAGEGLAGSDPGAFFKDGVTPFPYEDLPLVRALRGEASEGVEMFIRDERHPRGRFLRVNGRPWRDAAGTLLGGVVVYRDVTDELRAGELLEQTVQERTAALRATQEQLLQAQKMEAVGRLAGGIAHDFNNLLNAIMGYSDMLSAQMDEHDARREDLEQIVKAAASAAALTRQLLAFSRRQVIEPRVIDLNALMLDMDRLLRRVIGEDVELVTLPAAELGLVLVDPGQFEQVLMNLAVNARDAMPGGGKLTLESGNVTLDEEYARLHPGVESGAYVMLAVSDTGQGMTADVRARIFEPFFTTKEHGKGTGLGLSTCYGIVKQCGGHIWVYSEVGQGTTFKVYFPRVEGVGEAIRIHREEAPAGGTETVLVVEDEPSVRALAARVLRVAGYAVLEAGNGDEALRVAGVTDVDLLITDVVMPRMGGRELAARLLARRPTIKILYSSGYTDDAIVHHGVLEPGLAFLQKPYRQAALLAKVRAVLDS